MMVGSLDVENLYGSIDNKTAGEIVRKRFLKSSLEVEGIDYRWCMIYLKLTMSPHEIVDNKVQGILPRKLNNRKATILSVEADETTERWWYPVPPSFLTPEQKRNLISCVLQQMVKITFGSHFYEWEGKIYHQRTGGQTGLRYV